MTGRLRLRYLSYHGPNRDPAIVPLGAGLNVIYGASNTGKSFIVDTLDFMLGGKGPLRDIPERVGYNMVMLAVEATDSDPFTIARAVEGGPFSVHEGLLHESLPEGEGQVLAEQHNDRRDDNLSAFLLEKLGLGHKRIRKNKKGDTQSLSFRNLARLIVVNEEEIIQQRSPLSDGNYSADTANTSVFKLLLTGVDDSSAIAATRSAAEDHNRDGQIAMLDQLIGEYRKQIKALAGPPKELQDQLARLELTMAEQGGLLSVTEAQFKQATTDRRDVARRIEEARNRLTEITALLERFTLLKAHYKSDLERLEAIAEAGSLFGALAGASCPVCGAESKHHHPEQDCDGNTDSVVLAARAEMAKIETKLSELLETISTLRDEAVSFEKRLPALEARLSELSVTIDRTVAPNLKQMRSSYRTLADKSGEVREALSIHRALVDLEQRKAKIEGNDLLDAGPSNVVDVDLSTSTVDRFSKLVLEILSQWGFPDIDRVHFDMKVRDLIINGKPRTSYGKGLRAITQSAFTIGLMEYCARFDTPHAGFIVLDSPLLSYREPDSPADDLRSTDLNSRFYAYLAAAHPQRQFIIVENTDPPSEIRANEQSILFSGIREDDARFGLFALSDIETRILSP
jgi:hypothetical protein